MFGPARPLPRVHFPKTSASRFRETTASEGNTVVPKSPDSRLFKPNSSSGGSEVRMLRAHRSACKVPTSGEPLDAPTTSTSVGSGSLIRNRAAFLSEGQSVTDKRGSSSASSRIDSDERDRAQPPGYDRGRFHVPPVRNWRASFYLRASRHVSRLAGAPGRMATSGLQIQFCARRRWPSIVSAAWLPPSARSVESRCVCDGQRDLTRI